MPKPTKHTVHLILSVAYTSNGETALAVKQQAIHALRNFAVDNQRFGIEVVEGDEGNRTLEPLLPADQK